MKKLRKITSLMIAIVMCICLLPDAQLRNTVSAATSQIPATKIVLTVDDGVTVLNIGTEYVLVSKLTPKNSTDTIKYSSSNQKIATVSKEGVVTPIKTGNVKITATAQSGKKSSVSFLVVTANGTTALQSRADKMLKADNISKITIQNKSTSVVYKLVKGDYSDKVLTVNAPLSDVINSGTFKMIYIKDIKYNTWKERAKGNKFIISDDKFSFVADKNSEIESITLTGNNPTGKITNNGKINNLVIDTKMSRLTLTSNGDYNSVRVTRNAAGSNLSISSPMTIKTDAPMNITLEKGAQGSVIEKTDNNALVNVTNKSGGNVTIKNTKTGKSETLPNGKSKNENSSSTTNTPANNGNSSNGGSSSGSGSSGDNGGNSGSPSAISPANAQALSTAKTNAGNLTSTDYTSASWGDLTTALAMPETNNTEITAKTTAINTAIAGLVFAGTANLATAKSNVGNLTSTDYTSASWGNLTTALEMSENTNAEVIAKTDAINNSIAGLVSVGVALTTAKTNAGNLTSTDYTSASWGILTTALAMSETTNVEVVAKTTAINNAISGLVFAGTANLATAKTNAESLTSTDYTSASWGDLTTALAMPETNNTEITAKTTAINTAIAGLVFAGTANLATAKSNAGILTSTDYTSASWANLTTALGVPEITNAEVVAKTTAINNAIAGLVFAGLTDLETAKATAGNLTKADYSVVSWNKLTTALAMPETNNAEIVAKTTAINDAISKLTPSSKDVGVQVFIYGAKVAVHDSLLDVYIVKYPTNPFTSADETYNFDNIESKYVLYTLTDSKATASIEILSQTDRTIKVTVTAEDTRIVKEYIIQITIG